MKPEKSVQRIALFILSILLVVIFLPFISHAQSVTAPAAENVPFYNTSDFWSKVALAIISTLLGALSGYWSSERKRRDEVIELSYAQSKLSVLEFKKDVGKTLNIRYGNYEVADLYVVSCNIRNTCKKVIKNEHITFELKPANVGMLDQFFEPSLGNNNSMGIEEVPIDDLKVGEAKKKYLIRDISPGELIGFRFVTARLTQQDEEPNLFVYNKDDSKVQLVKVKGADPAEREENYKVTRFITLFILLSLLPPVFYLIPFVGQQSGSLVRLMLFVLIFPYIESFAERTSKFLAIPLQKSEPQQAKYNINIGTGTDVSIGDKYLKHQETNEANK